MRTGLHPYSLSQPPPLLPKLMDKLAIELALVKSIGTKNIHGRIDYRGAPRRSRPCFRGRMSCGGTLASHRAPRWTSPRWTRLSKSKILRTFTR